VANLVTVDDILTYMDIDLSNRQEDAAEFIIDGLESDLELYLGRPVTMRDFTEHHVVPSTHVSVPFGSYLGNGITGNQYIDNAPSMRNPHVVYLNNSPVHSVTTVTSTAASVGATVKTLTENKDFFVYDYGIEIPYAYAREKITVTYNAGLDGPNIKVFKNIILRAASREMQNMHDDVLGIKDLETRNVGPLDTGFLETELRAVKRYRRVKAGFGLTG
jgi:hypothetical protein